MFLLEAVNIGLNMAFSGDLQTFLGAATGSRMEDKYLIMDAIWNLGAKFAR